MSLTSFGHLDQSLDTMQEVQPLKPVQPMYLLKQAQ